MWAPRGRSPALPDLGDRQGAPSPERAAPYARENPKTPLCPRTEESLPDCAAPGRLAEGPEGQTEIQSSVHSSSRAFWSGNASTWRGRHKGGHHRARRHLCLHRLGILAAAAAKSLQSCLTLCDPRDSSPPGSPVPGILQARTLEWVAISFSNA